MNQNQRIPTWAHHTQTPRERTKHALMVVRDKVRQLISEEVSDEMRRTEPANRARRRSEVLERIKTEAVERDLDLDKFFDKDNDDVTLLQVEEAFGLFGWFAHVRFNEIPQF